MAVNRTIGLGGVPLVDIEQDENTNKLIMTVHFDEEVAVESWNKLLPDVREETMKCDELEFERLGDAYETYPKSTLLIRKQFVDAAIAELKEIIDKNKSAAIADASMLGKDIHELKAENERLEKFVQYLKDDAYKIRDYAQSLTKEYRLTKRALWIARAKRAIEKIAWFKLWNASISTMNPEDGARQDTTNGKRH